MSARAASLPGAALQPVFDKLDRAVELRRKELLETMADAASLSEAVDQIFVEVTSECNLGCPFCGRLKNAKPQGVMDPGLFRKIIDEIAEVAPAASVWLHKDGEPFLHPLHLELFAYAASRLSKVCVATNGTLLGDASLIRDVLRSGLHYLRFSVDGFTESAFERLRAGADFSEVLNNIRQTRKARDELGSRTRIGVRATLIGEVARRPPEFRAFWAAIVDDVELVPLMTWPEHSSAASAERVGMVAPDRLPCRSLFREITIEWDGKMAPCCVYSRPKGRQGILIGDLRHQSLSELWASERLRRLQREHISGVYCEADFCSGCTNNRTRFADALFAGGFREQMSDAFEAAVADSASRSAEVDDLA